MQYAIRTQNYFPNVNSIHSRYLIDIWRLQNDTDFSYWSFCSGTPDPPFVQPKITGQIESGMSVSAAVLIYTYLFFTQGITHHSNGLHGKFIIT